MFHLPCFELNYIRKGGYTGGNYRDFLKRVVASDLLSYYQPIKCQCEQINCLVSM